MHFIRLIFIAFVKSIPSLVVPLVIPSFLATFLAAFLAASSLVASSLEHPAYQVIEAFLEYLAFLAFLVDLASFPASFLVDLVSLAKVREASTAKFLTLVY